VLKQHWKVSMAAIIKRAWDVGSITERKYRSLFTGLGAQGYRLNEPFPITPEEPQLIKHLVAYHRNELGYDDFDLAGLLFSPDPQFFESEAAPTILKFDNRPFFAFFPDSGKGRRRSV
jgi:hypothetical protein